MLEASRWGHTGEGKEAGPSEQGQGTQHGQHHRGSQDPWAGRGVAGESGHAGHGINSPHRGGCRQRPRPLLRVFRLQPL